MTQRKVLSFAGVGVLAAGMLLAQGSRGMQDRESSGTAKGNRLDFLTTFLDLTDAQKTQAQAILDAATAAISPITTQLKDNRTAIETAVTSAATDTALQTLTTTEGSLVAQIALLRAKAARDFYAILTQTQKDKLAKAPGSVLGLLGGGAWRF